MPQQIINVYDRPTYETEKVKGWDVVRMFKASALTSEQNGGEFSVAQDQNIIQEFTQNYASNYKGTNLIDLSKLENFDSIRLRMNGLFFDSSSGGWFNFFLRILDGGYNVITDIRSNYGEKLDQLRQTDTWQDWYLDIELTFFIDDTGNPNFIVNGNYSASLISNIYRRNEVSLVPFNGVLSFSPLNQKVYIDLSPWNGGSNDYIIKSINMDFVE